jgi:hypothetical protein
MGLSKAQVLPEPSKKNDDDAIEFARKMRGASSARALVDAAAYAKSRENAAKFYSVVEELRIQAQASKAVKKTILFKVRCFAACISAYCGGFMCVVNLRGLGFSLRCRWCIHTTLSAEAGICGVYRLYAMLLYSLPCRFPSLGTK